MKYKQLQQGNVETWTYLIRQNARLRESTVVQVDLSSTSAEAQQATVYLSSQQDPLTFLLYRTSPGAAYFFEQAAEKLSFILPRIWLTENPESHEDPGVVMEDIEPTVPSGTWPLGDLDRLAEQLAKLHASFWQSAAAGYRKLPFALNPPGDDSSIDLFEDRPSDDLPLPDSLSTQLASIDPAIVQKTHDLWPEVLSARHLQAAKELLRKPELLLRPLLTLPQTVIHGRPTLPHWRLTLFGNSYLLNWRHVSVGPAVFDLDQLLFSIPDEPRPDRAGRLSPWKTASESFLDSYFVALSETLHDQYGYGVAYSSRYMRRFALPAARCWLILNQHLPELLANRETAKRERAERLWGDFLDSYRLLTSYVKGMSQIDIRKV